MANASSYDLYDFAFSLVDRWLENATTLVASSTNLVLVVASLNALVVSSNTASSTFVHYILGADAIVDFSSYDLRSASTYVMVYASSLLGVAFVTSIPIRSTYLDLASSTLKDS